MLAKVGVLTKAESEKITTALKKIEKEIDSGQFNFKIELEDIHMNIESRLKEIIKGLIRTLYINNHINY